MADAFDAMIESALAFLPRLRAHNDRAWFESHKAAYTSQIARPAGLFADTIGHQLEHAFGDALTPKVFRIHRDVRFSKDKTPYHTHLHLSWQAAGVMPHRWFFGLSPDYFVCGIGLMQLSGEDLARFRAYVDAHGDALAMAVEEARLASGATIADWGPDPLKRVPKPYAADHPHGDLLRRKSFAVTVPMGDDWRKAGIVQSTLRKAEALRGIHACLVAVA